MSVFFIATMPAMKPTKTMTILAETADGYVETNQKTSYALSHDANNGDEVKDDLETIMMGQHIAWSDPPPTHRFYHERGFEFFDTSVLAGKEIVSVKQRFHLQTYTANGRDIVVQNGMPTYPHDPLELGDYDKDHYSGEGGRLTSVEITGTGEFFMTFNATGRSWIKKTGITKLCYRSSRDIDNQPPDTPTWPANADEYYRWWSAEVATESQRPALIIEYR